jgi:hypothetical protein
MLCAPHGGGKTTALLQYAARAGSTGIVTLPRNASSDEVSACLAPHHGAALTIIDQADAASPEGRATLFASIEEQWPRGGRYLLGGSSRTHMRAQALIARGVASLIDASQLAFSSADIAALAAAHRVAADEIDVEQLRYDTDGWPLAVAWIVRDAARDGRALRGAYEHWRERNGHLLLELVAISHDDEAATAFVSAVWSLGDPRSQRALERLDAEGFPIVRMRTSVRPYRVLMQIACEEPALETIATVDTRLILNLFGRFSCTIANRPVVFDRRRDQNVLTYVALAPGATVTRAALLDAFWPDATRAVASQGLRTTLCRLRHALAAAAGTDAGRYVRVDNAITLDLDWVSIDARTFRAYVAMAEIDDANGNHNAAREHYLKAEQLYTGSLLASEALEDTLAPHAVEYGELFEDVLLHLVASYARDGNADRQHAFADRRTLRGAPQPA